MFSFNEKKVLVISPQPWGVMKVSKHHYAIELRKRGCKVFFLDPPTKKVSRGTCRISRITDEGITVLEYQPYFPVRFKDKFPRLFNLFTALFIRKLNKAIGGKADIVWDFEPNRYFPDLSNMAASLAIYHPVDVTAGMNGSTKNADIIFSVADVLLDKFINSRVPAFFVNHGVGEQWAQLAAGMEENSVENKQIRFGYIGNLLMRYIDHKGVLNIIENHPKIHFDIWGPYNYQKEWGLKKENVAIAAFIERLKNCRNVKMHGMTPQDNIITAIGDIDGFFWCFDNERDPNKGSNSHKILEYLSTGKVLVSTYISTYKDIKSQDLIVMADKAADFPGLFGKVVADLKYYNSTHLQKQRKMLALANTYEQQLYRIEKMIDKTLAFKYSSNKQTHSR